MAKKRTTYHIQTSDRNRFLITLFFALLICFSNILTSESFLEFESDKIESLVDAELDIDIEEKEKTKELENDYVLDHYFNCRNDINLLKNLIHFNSLERIYYSNIPTPPPDLSC